MTMTTTASRAQGWRLGAPGRLAAFGAGLLAVFAASYGAGLALRPSAPPAEPSGGGTGGLSATGDGYSFVPDVDVLAPGAGPDFTFRILGPDGRPVTAYRTQHERDLHLIVASADLGWFAHVHPAIDSDGRWSVPLALPAPGTYRAFADFAVAGGPALTLGVELTAPGSPAPRPLPAPSVVDRVDGYEVVLLASVAGPGEQEVVLRVARDGRPVTDLDPYLGAYGHLVALRAGDLAYSHVHPEDHAGEGGAGPEVAFVADLPTAGDYRLFFDFSHHGTVRTASFTVTVPAVATGGPVTTTAPVGHGHGR